MTDKNIINVFISSKNRDNNSKPYLYNCYLPDNMIVCEPSQGIRMNIISFDMVNSMYNMNSQNNFFQLIETDLNGDNPSINYITIPEGNYNVLEIMNFINANNSIMNISYDKISNKYIYNKTDELKRVFLDVKNTGEFLGFNKNSYIEIINGLVSTNKLNIVYSNKVLIRTTNLSFELANLENINITNNYNTFEISNIILWLSKNDIAPFQVISYNNYDGGNSYSYNLYNRSVNNIQFLLTNEYDEVITDCPDWTMTLQFSIYERKNEETLKVLNIISSYLRGIYVMLNIFYDYVKKF